MLLPSVRSAALLTALLTSLCASFGLTACKEDKAAAPKADAAVDTAEDTAAADADPVDTTAADAAPADAAPTACPVCTSAQYCDEATFACVARKPEAEVAGQRTACAFGPGDLASKTLGKEVPTGKAIPINHFVLVMMENRSFDHYFGAGKDFGLDVDGIAPGQGNPDGKGNTIAPFHTTAACIEDVTHSWVNVHKQLGDGKMDGFVTTNQPDGERAMGYFDGTDLVFYYDVARTFGLSDRHFCSALGPTWINRMFLWPAPRLV